MIAFPRCRSVEIALLAGILVWVPALAGQKLSPPAAVLSHPALGTVPEGARFDASGHLDPELATQAYLSTIPAEKRQASNRYFEGGYWLNLWDALLTIAILWVLLRSGFSAHFRDFAARRTRNGFLQPAIYFVLFFLTLTVLEAPWRWYESFYREHIYGQTEQALGGWLRDQVIGLGLTLVFGALLVGLLYVIVRRLPRTWHLWCAGTLWLFGAVLVLVSPVFLAPLFNTYSRIADPAVVEPVLRMARANGIPVTDLYQVDASRQSTQVSANVSGLFGTTRITLNDNLLRLCSVEEIEETSGHEMGHYVLHHVSKSLIDSLILIFLLFALLRRWLEGMQRRHGARWGTEGVADPALLPGAVLCLTVMSLLLTPLTNTLTRTQEREADLYGLNAARQPDASAQVDLKLGQYRKLEPTPLEEVLFFDHPSGHTRILDAMRWKAENAGTPGYR